MYQEALKKGKESDNFMRTNVFQKITPYDIAYIFNQAAAWLF